MRSKILIIAFILFGFTSCTQRVMCPAYATVEDHQEIKDKSEEQKSI